MKVKVVIDANEIELIHKGQHQGYEKFTAPKEISGLVVTVFIEPNWDPEKRRTRSNALRISSPRIPLLLASSKEILGV